MVEYPQAGWHRSERRQVNYTVIYEPTPTGFSANIPDGYE
jgi:hypothetical protein